MNTILIAEDHELSRDALSRRLERRGYRVVGATNGEEALTLARAEAPDLILMDLGLPKIDGWAATRCLKAEAATRRIPIIVLSAHAAGENRDFALAIGGDDVDTKPVRFDALLTKIDALLKRSPTAPSEGDTHPHR